MKSGEKGFTLVELLVSLAITVLITAAAGAALFQVFQASSRNNDYMTAVRQVENAGFWISRDAQMANSVTTNTTLPDFLVINWTEWITATSANYHSATYFFDGLANGIGSLKRNHWSTAGDNQTTLIAGSIYYNPVDTVNTTSLSYEGELLTVRVTALCENTMETREYIISRRTNQ